MFTRDDKVCKGDGVIYFLVLAPINNGSFTKAPVDEDRNDPDGVLITETPDIIAVSMGEDLDTNYVIYGLVGTSLFSVK